LGRRVGQLDEHKHLGIGSKANQVTHITAERTEVRAIQKGEVIVSQFLSY